MSSSETMSRAPDSQKQNSPRRAGRRRLRRLLLASIGLLYLVSVPWYRGVESGEAPRLLFGLPDWVAVSLACYIAAALLNAAAWLLTDLHDGPGTSTSGEEAPR